MQNHVLQNKVTKDLISGGPVLSCFGFLGLPAVLVTLKKRSVQCVGFNSVLSYLLFPWLSFFKTKYLSSVQATWLPQKLKQCGRNVVEDLFILGTVGALLMHCQLADLLLVNTHSDGIL